MQPTKSSGPTVHEAGGRSTYGILVAASSALLLGAVFLSSYPIPAGAFWPFTLAQAQEDGTPPVIHDEKLALLEAPIHSDPNPSKGVVDIPVSENSALIGTAGPSGTLPAATGASASSGAISRYEVREGDSLSVIADMFGVSINTILWANGIKDASTIQPGTTLLILPVSGVQHHVKKGQTLAGIAKLYDVPLEDVAGFNGLAEDAAIAEGDTLIIPGAELETKAAAPNVASGSSAPKAAAPVRKALPVLDGYFGNPVPGAYVSQGLHGHNGVDLAGIPKGTPVYAAAAGTVIDTYTGGGYNLGYGNYVVIAHDNGTQTLYAHLSTVTTGTGARVEKGEQIGGIGNTGRATGFHLHFEVRGAANPFAN